MVNNGNPLTADLLVKVMERVYPDDKGVMFLGPILIFPQNKCFLTYYQMTNFRLFQSERVCRGQFQI